jgi:peptidyl-prolyl cis-trans isomerase A (cyclophilin A)
MRILLQMDNGRIEIELFEGRSQPDELGFPAFGEVVVGLDVAQKIAESETAGAARIGMLEGQILTRAVAITAAQRSQSPS